MFIHTIYPIPTSHATEPMEGCSLACARIALSFKVHCLAHGHSHVSSNMHNSEAVSVGVR